MYEYVPTWSGGRIGAGATVFHFDGAGGPGPTQALANACAAWFSSRSAALPNDVTVAFPNEVKEMSGDGTLAAVHAVSGPASVVGTYSGNWSNGQGRVVRLTTNTIINGRRLIGRIFLVPSGGVEGDSGDILAATITADQAVHNTLLSAAAAAGAPLVVWSRVGETTGLVTGMRTLPRPSHLSTRNDRL